MTTEQKIALDIALSKDKYAKAGGKTWEQVVVKSNWFKLATAQTIRKKQATRVLIGENIVYYIQAEDVLLNLCALTEEAWDKKNFNFTEEISKL